MSSTGASGQLVTVHPNELKFLFELEKQSYCDLKVVNNTEKHVAFKVKTTSPKKYFVRPNSGVIQPWDSFAVRVTLQAQREYPPDMQCKDKFLLQSTTVPPHSDVDELPADTFTKDSGKILEECKLKVVYLPPGSNGNSEEGVRGFGGGPDASSTVQQLKEERDSAVRQTQQLQQELGMLKKQRNQKKNGGFSMKVALIVAFIGVMLGFLLNMSSSSPSVSTEVLTTPVEPTAVK